MTVGDSATAVGNFFGKAEADLMGVRFCTAAREALGATWERLLGNGDCWLEFYSGPMPATPDDPPKAELLLARLYVKPNMRAEMDNAVRSGDASWCRVVATDGRAVADFDVTLKGGGGTLQFNTLGIRRGGPVTLYGPILDFFNTQPLTRDEEDERAIRNY
jgi:hypothetical protein